jgi:hypothetical protein
LNDEDKTLLIGETSAGLKTVTLVRRSGVLDLLPNDIDDHWPNFGRVINNGVVDAWVGGQPPTVVRGRNVWVMKAG